MKALALAALCLAGAPALASEASDLFAKKCATCHGDDGQGHTRMGKRFHAPDFTAAKFQARATDDKMRQVIQDGVYEDGVHKMPAWKDKLTAAQIDGLVQLVRSFGKR